MSTSWGTGYTVATIFISGLLIFFILPTVAYMIIQGFAYLLTPLEALCDNALESCTKKSITFSTVYGDVPLTVTKVEESSTVAVFANISVDLLVAFLQLISRIEVLVAAFMVDLITIAYEITD